jgi:hypothetical protein
MIYEVALVTDRAGTFATALSKPVPRFVEGGRIVVTTLATFDHEDEAQSFLRGLRSVEVQERERMPRDIEALEWRFRKFWPGNSGNSGQVVRIVI